MADELTIVAGGSRFSGWQSVRVSRSIEQLCASFEFGLVDQRKKADEALALTLGQEVQVKYGDEVVITGYIDQGSVSYAARRHVLSVSGRSKTQDLVDCAAVNAPGRWNKASLTDIASALCSPFGISVTADAPVGDPFPRFAVHPGETVFECLERAARMRGLLLMTDEHGDLVLARAGSESVSTTLELGVNILSGSRSGSWRDRFSEYRAYSQTSGTDEWYGDQAASPKASSEDSLVTRYRPTVIMAETQESRTSLQTRADWERNVRAGRSLTATYEIAGWEHADGLWAPNALVSVIDPWLEINGQLLIVSVEQQLSQEGRTTTLGLALPHAYDVEPLPTSRKGRFL
jgi:prophage tail gpP-like protein